MIAFKASLQNELIRMLKKRKTVVMLVVNILIYVAIMSALSFIHIKFNDILSLFVISIFPLYIFIETVEVFSTEYMSNTIKNVLIRPISRFKIYLSKVTALTCFVAAHLINLFIVTSIGNLIVYGEVSVLQNAVAYFVTLIPLIALVVFASFIVQLFRNGFLAMLVCLLFYLGARVIEFLFTKVSAFLFTSYLTWYKIFIISPLDIGQIISKFIFIASFSIIVFIFGYLLFDRKEF